MTIFRTTISKVERNECTHHRVIPHYHSPTSNYKGAEGVKKERSNTVAVYTLLGTNPSTLTKCLHHFSNNSNKLDVINSNNSF